MNRESSVMGEDTYMEVKQAVCRRKGRGVHKGGGRERERKGA